MTKLIYKHMPLYFMAPVVVSIIFLSNQVLGEKKQDSKNGFPHSVHIIDLGCLDCHETAKSQPEAGSPEAEFCLSCHDHHPTYYSNKKKHISSSVRTFSHFRHKGETCETCHGKLDPKGANPEYPDPNDCLTCHNRQEIAKTCITCHEQNNFTPAYHAQDWNMKHGPRTQRKSKNVHGWDCSVCHAQDKCVACHKVEKPKNHTAFFRIRGHGLKAEFSRDSCATCHEQSYCIRCHSHTKPLNHRGQWSIYHGKAISGGYEGGLGKCAVCHNASWCATCHQQ